VTATATEDSHLLAIPAAVFLDLVKEHPEVRRFFDRTRPTAARRQDITTMALSDLMTPNPLVCAPGTPLIQAAQQKMRDLGVSCIIAADQGRRAGDSDDRRHHEPRGCQRGCRRMSLYRAS
jgi:CBS domain-containing protein